MGWNYDPDAIHAHQSGEINALTEKTTPHADDLLLGEDSENSGAKVGIKVGNLGGGAEVLDDLTDVDTTGVADGDVLVYDADTSTWVPGEGGGGNASYSEKVGDESTTTFEIEHSLDSSAVIVEVIEVSSGAGLVAGTDYTWSVISDDKIEVVFSSAPGTDDALVVVLASGGTSSGGGGGGEALRGVARIDDPDTEVTVNHGLPRAPEHGEIQVTPQADEDGWLDGAASAKFAVKNLSLLTFDIEVDAAPGSGKHATFDWLWVPADPAILPAYVEAVLDDNPLAYYRLGESSVGPIIDQMGGTAGTVNGTLTFGVTGAIAGDADTAIQLPSANLSNYIDLPQTLDSQDGDGFAIEFWIAEWSSGNNSIPIRDHGSSDNTFPLFDNGGTIRYRVRGSDFNSGVASSGYLGLSTFTHVVVEYVHSGPTVNLYLDGTLAHTSSTSSKSGATSVFRLFRSGTTNNSSPCILDEVALYQHPLGATRVGVHYAAGIGA